MMGAMWQVFRFEVRYYARSISTYVYFGIFAALSVLLIAAMGGAFKSVSAGFGGGGGNVMVNSPWALTSLISAVSLFGVIVTAAMLGHSAQRDFETGAYPLFFTQPISKGAFLGGRFLGGLLANAFVFVSIPLGIWLGAVLPFLDAERVGPHVAMYYLQPFLVIVLPNLIFTGALFFALAVVTRRMLPNYVGGAVLLIGYLISAQLVSDMENQMAASLVDPFGGQAFSNLTKYWTVAEKNALLIPVSGEFLYNRLLWMAVGAGVFAVCYKVFRFSHLAPAVPFRKKTQAPVVDAPARTSSRRVEMPAATRSFSGSAVWLQFTSMTRQAFITVARNVYFYAIVGAGLLFLGFSAPLVGELYGTSTFPVTYATLEVLEGSFSLFVLVLIAFYSGELVWEERDLKADQMYDSTPMPTWVPFVSKLAALAMTVAILLAVVMLAGMVTQAFQGYFEFEVGLYVQTLFGLRWVDYLLLCVVALLVHTLVNHKYMGHMIIIGLFVFTLFMGQLGLEHNLYRYGSDVGQTYSDMNRFGPYLGPFFWFKLYWGGVAVLFALVSDLFWVRGVESGRRFRMRLAKLRMSRTFAGGAVLALALTMVTGGFIFYNTNVLNEYRTGLEGEELQARYEREYKQFEHMPKPRVVAVDVEVDLYPYERDAELRGVLTLTNKTDGPVDSVHVNLISSLDVQELTFGRPAELVHNDEALGYRIYAFDAPFQPGDTTTLTFGLDRNVDGFGNSMTLGVVGNGTFVNSSLIPSLGYSPNGELGDDNTRRKHGLEPRERVPAVDDSVALMDNYISLDADWVDFKATVSTVEDQIAIAPGYLQEEWVEDGRRYFRYEMDDPILNFYSFLSAEWEVATDRWNDVDIAVYYHPGHEYNIERMISSVKKSLDYFSEHWGPYQHRQVRILEFPRYATFAQSFPNTIPYSEAIGFIADVDEDDPDAIDYPFYVTAHEVAHQWWAHQVIGGRVQGSTVLSETMSQYSALMVMEHEYGPEKMKRFLEYEMDQYLAGRSFETKKELPLILNENQGYIHYRKGSVVMYALKDYIGEDAVNQALADFLDEARYQGPPYPNSLALLEHLKAVTPDSLQYVIEDMFETITLYENRSVDATASEEADGSYLVQINVESSKFRADSLGNESKVDMNDLIDIGVFGEDENGDEVTLYLAKHRLVSGEQQVEVRVSGLPVRAGIDPGYKLVDRHKDDNVVDVDVAGGGG
jgi:ABC-type transport system involved in multi-copper enzyme maturation permease subunit